MSELDQLIRKHVLKNAFDYGKANSGSVVGKIIAENADAKKDMKELMKKISVEVTRVNKLKKEEIEKELGNYSFAEKKEKEKGLVLPDAVQGKVTTRFAPEPNGYPHIGHAKAVFLSFECSRVYGGKMLLRFDDTNPEAEEEQYVGAIMDGLKWLGVEWNGSETYASDSLPVLYEHAKKLLAQGDAYACSCEAEQVKKNRGEEKECACRRASPGECLDAFAKMLGGEFDQGDVIIRFKGDLRALNTVMRDPTMLRIIDAPHYRQGKKFHVWPSYDFEAPIIDSLTGITHAMRSKEYELRDELYYELLKRIGLRAPRIVEFSRLSIKGMPISKRLLKPLVREGKVSGWDDPRLPTLVALKRRGILPEAIKRFVLSFGLGKQESEPTIDALLAENGKLLDSISPRFFFVTQPVKVSVENIPSELSNTAIQIKKHPSLDMGFRELAVGSSFFVCGGDAEKLSEGDVFRLKDLYNVKITKKGKKELRVEFAGKELIPGSKKFQWVPEKQKLDAVVLVPGELLVNDAYNPDSLKEVKGFCEKACGELKKGDAIQFERFGFCKLDDKKKNSFIFTNP
ncbi:glutamate--tRNA ligase [Candidatus Micrarchaeota archaeon]|nr:glutamate--tRNA ligase [Candidatus Micrarchaeota archaeon]